MRQLLALSLACSPLAAAQVTPAPFAVGGEYQWEADLEDSGSFSRTMARARISAPLYRSEETVAALSFGYQFESFDFSGLSTDPWDELHRLRLGLVLKSDLVNDWSWLALSWMGADVEPGSDWGESITFGGVGGVWYEFSDRLSLGLGAGISSRLEDDPSIFPILILDWKLSPCLTLTTIPPEGFRVGPGVSLRWDLREDLDLALIYQYQGDQQRLDENSAASPDGIGEFRQSRVALSATKRFGDAFSLTGHAGVAFGGELELQDAGGDTLSKQDFDSSLVIGLEGSLRF